MTEETKSKLVSVLKNNTKWPLIIEGASKDNFPTSIIVPSNIPSSELGIVSDETGYKYPNWLTNVVNKAKKSKRVLVCIDSLDKVSEEEQEKFYGLLKHKSISGFRLPEAAQIIITVKNLKKVSKRILDLSLVFKAGR